MKDNTKMLDILTYRIDKLKKEIYSGLQNYNDYLHNNLDIINKLLSLKKNMIEYHQNKIIAESIKKANKNNYTFDLIDRWQEKDKTKNTSEQPVVNFDRQTISYIDAITNPTQQGFTRAYYYHIVLTDAYLQAAMNILTALEKKLPTAYRLGKDVIKKTNKHNQLCLKYNSLSPAKYGRTEKQYEDGLQHNEIFNLIYDFNTYCRQIAKERLNASELHLNDLKYSKEKFIQLVENTTSTMGWQLT